MTYGRRCPSNDPFSTPNLSKLSDRLSNKIEHNDRNRVSEHLFPDSSYGAWRETPLRSIRPSRVSGLAVRANPLHDDGH